MLHDMICRNGYELYRPGNGIVGIGAVIKSFGSVVPGALGVIIPEFRFVNEYQNAILKEILHTEKMITVSK